MPCLPLKLRLDIKAKHSTGRVRIWCLRADVAVTLLPCGSTLSVT